MKPYDWCDPRCPNPCTCQETIERNLVGICPDCRGDLDTEEVIFGADHLEAYCSTCNAYKRKSIPRNTYGRRVVP